MKIDLTEKQFRRLLDLVYIGNWVLNSTRGDDRIREYDEVESTVFSNCINHGMVPLVESYQGELIPSRAFAEGGIHEAILAYEDTMFFDNDPLQAQQRVRLAMWGLNGSLLFLLGLLLWRAAGLAWAAGTLAFLALEPTIGAHLPVVMTDGPLASTLAPATRPAEARCTSPQPMRRVAW